MVNTTKLTFEQIIEHIIAIALNKNKDTYKNHTYNIDTPIVSEFGLDSLDLVELFVEIETEYNIEIPQEILNLPQQQPDNQTTTAYLATVVATMTGVDVPPRYIIPQAALRPLLTKHVQNKQLKKQQRKKNINTIITSAVIIACMAGLIYTAHLNRPNTNKTIKTEKNKIINHKLITTQNTR